jgi:hypothetical protein
VPQSGKITDKIRKLEILIDTKNDIVLFSRRV